MSTILSETATASTLGKVRFTLLCALCLAGLVGCNQPIPPHPSIIPPHPHRRAKNTINLAVERFEYRRIIMGVEAQIILFTDSEANARAAATAAFARLDALETVLSDYRKNSEVNQVCKLARNATAANPVALPISADLATIINRAEKISIRTNGAFDITLGPLTSLWRQSRRSGNLPTTTELAEHRQATGYQNLQLKPAALNNTHTLIFSAPAMQLDFGGIGKGYAADEALKILRNNYAIITALVNIGGDLAAGDPPPKGAAEEMAAAGEGEEEGKGEEGGWAVPLHTFDPTLPDETLRIANRAVATSGDLEKFTTIAGVRYSHILNPATGLGLTRRIAVTVIAADATTADALASALSVLGPIDGLALIETWNDIEARVVELLENGATAISQSSGFAAKSNCTANAEAHSAP